MSSAPRPWFLPIFLAVWTLTMVYVVTFFTTVVRLRRLTGEAEGPMDWLNVWRRPQSIKYLRWFFSARHRDLGDPWVSRATLVIRALFVVLLPTVLLVIFVLGPQAYR